MPMSEADFPALKPVTLWLCLEPNGHCGLWCRDEADARRALGTFQTIVPVEIPGVCYAGIAIGAPFDTEAEAEGAAIEEE
jgi:hypothetical protein